MIVAHLGDVTPREAMAAIADPAVRARAQSLHNFDVVGETPSTSDSHLFGYLLNDLAAQVLDYLGRPDPAVQRASAEAVRYRTLLEGLLAADLANGIEP
jgi:hypothetical protein